MFSPKFLDMIDMNFIHTADKITSIEKFQVKMLGLMSLRHMRHILHMFSDNSKWPQWKQRLPFTMILFTGQLCMQDFVLMVNRLDNWQG